MMQNAFVSAILLFSLFLFVSPDPALAYIGPGVGLGALGTLFALIGAVFLAIVGFLWYPVKRLLRRLRATTAEGDDQIGE